MGYFFPETLYIESFSFGNTSGVALSYQIKIDYSLETNFRWRNHKGGNKTVGE